MRLRTHNDADLLKQPDEPEALREAIAAEREDLAALRVALEEKESTEPNELDVTRLGRTLNRLADHLRLADRCDAAADAAREALRIWEKLERRKAAFLAKLRLAKIERRAGSPDDALDILDELLEASNDEDLSIYRDFALETRALCHYDCGAEDRALNDLDEALERRVARGSQRQIEETRELIERIASSRDRPR